ncbi:hypothetical protein AB4P93_00040 (plasmid) [Pseudomonas sp. B26140]|uniref:hypothetical protein n=1 Tax=Pseudomonas sp. B26140 TaxID=3235112 RepID=UPI00378432E8
MNEWKIQIEGVTLSTGQAMTLRVALAALIERMEQDGLGESEHGRAMAAAYIERGYEIIHLAQKG